MLVSVFCHLLDTAIEAGRAGDHKTFESINARVKAINLRFEVSDERLYMIDATRNVAIASDPLVKLRIRTPRR